MNIYKESILKNNLKIITGENPNSEIVTISIWIKAGSRYEKKDQLGYAHVLEHIMLKGTKKYPSIFEISAVQDRVGAASNAFTGPERIYFFIQVSKKYLEKMFELLSDIILNPLFDSRVLENEKQVVIQEIHLTNDNISKRLWRFSMEKIFIGHPLAQNSMGKEECIISSNVDRITDYYKKFFIPGRAAIIVNGGVSHEEILILAEKFFNKWSGENIVDNLFSLNIISKNFFETKPIKQTNLLFSYVIQRITFKESVVLDIIANYLGSGQSAFLYQELRHKTGLVYGISVGNENYQDANIFFIKTSTTKPEDVVAIVKEKIENLENYFSESLLQEIKEQTISMLLRAINDAYKEIAFLGNGWRIYNRLITPIELIEEIRKIEYTDFLEVKNKYLNKNGLCVSAIGGKNPFK